MPKPSGIEDPLSYAQLNPPIKTQRAAPQAFPWLLFAVTWAALFGIQQRMDAPCQSNEGSVADIISTARNGSLPHQLLTLLLGAIGVALIYRGRRRLHLQGLVGYLYCAYFSWILLSATWADDLPITARRQLAFVLMSIFTLGCVVRMNPRTLSTFVVGIATFNLVPGLIAEMRCGDLKSFLDIRRFGGTLDPNIQGASLSMAVIFLLWHAARTYGYVRFWVLFASAVLLLFVAMTGSRSSMLALGAALGLSALMVLLRKERKRLSTIVPLLVITSGIAGTGAIAVSSGAIQLCQRGAINALRTERDYGDVTELTGRVLIWQECLAFAAERPVLGYGFGDFWSNQRAETISDDLKWPVPHAHSAYLDQLLSLGAPGLAAYILLLLGCFLVYIARFFGRSSSSEAYGAWAALSLFVIIHGTTESITVLPTFPEFVLALGILHLAFIKTTTNQEEINGSKTRIHHDSFMYL